MTLTVQRNDEFFDHIFNYHFFLNGKRYKLSHNQEIQIDLNPGQYEVYAEYQWLKSKKKKIQITEKDARIELKLFMDRHQWYKLLIVIVLSILAIVFGNDFLQDFGIFVIKAWLVFYLFMLTIGSENFMRILFEEELL